MTHPGPVLSGTPRRASTRPTRTRTPEAGEGRQEDQRDGPRVELQTEVPRLRPHPVRKVVTTVLTDETGVAWSMDGTGEWTGIPLSGSPLLSFHDPVDG